MKEVHAANVISGFEVNALFLKVYPAVSEALHLYHVTSVRYIMLHSLYLIIVTFYVCHITISWNVTCDNKVI